MIIFEIKSIRVIFTLILIKTNILYCQDLCFKVDSVMVTYIPWQLDTYMSLDEIDVRTFNVMNFKKEKLLLDSASISEIVLCHQKMVTVNINSIDCRMIIDLYFDYGKLTILIDSKGNCRINNKYYIRNPDLVKWINKYVVHF